MAAKKQPLRIFRMDSNAGLFKMKTSRLFRDKVSVAFLVLVFGLMLHVFDEAVTDFLSFYNPLVLELRERFSFIPFPTFSFNQWIIGLSLLIILLMFISPLIYKRNRVLIRCMNAFAGLMILNGLGHIVGSVYYSRQLPGLYSSPFLIGCSVYFLVISYRDQTQKHR